MPRSRTPMRREPRVSWCRSGPRSAPAIPCRSANAGSDRETSNGEGSEPHPVLAVVFLPAGQTTMAELQKQPVVVIDQSAATEVAKGEVDLSAPSAADILQRLTEHAGGLFHAHPEGKRRVVRQGRDERLALGIVRRKLLGFDCARCNDRK